MNGLHGEAMVWAIIGHDGMPIIETFAPHNLAAWHRYIQVNGAVDKEDAVTMVLEAQRSGMICQCLAVRAEQAQALRIAR